MARPVADKHNVRIGTFDRLLHCNPMACAALLLLCLYWSAAILVFAVDPYDIYPWGVQPGTPARDRSDNSMFVIAAAAKRHDLDVVMIGASVSKTYTPEQILRIAPGAKQAWNTSYPGAHPMDRATTIDTFLKYSNPKRFVIWIDWTYVLRAEARQRAFPDYLYDSSHFNDLRMVNVQAVAAARARLLGESSFREGEREEQLAQAGDAAKYKAFQTRQSMRNLQQVIHAQRREVARPWRASCEPFTAVEQQLIPELKEFSRRKVQVDLVFPAFSAVSYFQGAFRGGGPTLPAQLNLRRCIVAATSTISGVSVWAPDADTTLIADLGNYMDLNHLYGDAVLVNVLNRIGNPAFRIDAANVDTYLDRLRTTVMDYQLRNSHLDTDHRHGS